MFSTPESSSATTLNGKTLGSRGTEAPPPWDEKVVVSESPAPQPPVPMRSTFASVCIVAACTSTLTMSIALGPSVSILLPYTGKDLHIPKENLQWILNAYSISSVSNSDYYVHASAPGRKCSPWLYPTGMLTSSLRATGRPLRSQTSLAYWILHFGGVFCRRWIRSM